MPSGTPRYLRANVRLGGLHDREEHEADHAAGVIAAGGCHRVHDPGGMHHLRATGTAAATTRPSPAIADGAAPGGEGGVWRLPAHESGDAGGSAHLRAHRAHAVVDPGAEGRIRRAPAHEPDNAGAGHLRANAAPAVTQPSAGEPVRRASSHDSETGAVRTMPAAVQQEPETHVRASPATDPEASSHVRAKRAHEAIDPGGSRSLRAMPARVIDP